MGRTKGSTKGLAKDGGRTAPKGSSNNSSLVKGLHYDPPKVQPIDRNATLLGNTTNSVDEIPQTATSNTVAVTAPQAPAVLNSGLASSGLQGVDTNKVEVKTPPSGSTGTPNNPWLGSNGYLAGIASGVNAASSLANAYTGYEGLQLAKQQYEADKRVANRNAYNNAMTYNGNLDTRTGVGLSLAGGTLNDAQRAQVLAQTEKQKLSTAPIV